MAGKSPARTQAIPATKVSHASAEEKEELRSYRHGEENLYEAGIRVGQSGFYDPEKGSQNAREPRSESNVGPILATDPGQPQQLSQPSVVGRQPAVDRSERAVVSSRGTGRKATPKESSGTES